MIQNLFNRISLLTVAISLMMMVPCQTGWSQSNPVQVGNQGSLGGTLNSQTVNGEQGSSQSSFYLYRQVTQNLNSVDNNLTTLSTNEVADNFTGQFDPSLSNPWPEGDDAELYYGEFSGNTSYTLESSDGFGLSENNNSLFYYQAIWWEVSESGTVSFDWNYETDDYSPAYDPAGYLKNMPEEFAWYGNQFGSEFGVYQMTDDDGGLVQNGSMEVVVDAGGIFGFYVYSSNVDDGPSYLTITNFSFTPGTAEADPCDDKIVMDLDVEYTADLVPNSGVWVNYAGYITGDIENYTGSEQVFEFTAPEAGDYVIYVNEGVDNADFFLMDGCSNTAGNLLGVGYSLDGGVVFNRAYMTFAEGETI